MTSSPVGPGTYDINSSCLDDRFAPTLAAGGARFGNEVAAAPPMPVAVDAESQEAMLSSRSTPCLKFVNKENNQPGMMGCANLSDEKSRALAWTQRLEIDRLKRQLTSEELVRDKLERQTTDQRCARQAVEKLSKDLQAKDRAIEELQGSCQDLQAAQHKAAEQLGSELETKCRSIEDVEKRCVKAVEKLLEDAEAKDRLLMELQERCEKSDQERLEAVQLREQSDAGAAEAKAEAELLRRKLIVAEAAAAETGAEAEMLREKLAAAEADVEAKLTALDVKFATDMEALRMLLATLQADATHYAKALEEQVARRRSAEAKLAELCAESEERRLIEQRWELERRAEAADDRAELEQVRQERETAFLEAAELRGHLCTEHSARDAMKRQAAALGCDVEAANVATAAAAAELEAANLRLASTQAEEKRLKEQVAELQGRCASHAARAEAADALARKHGLEVARLQLDLDNRAEDRERLETDSRSLKESLANLEAELERAESEIAMLSGHTNHKQKIQYMQRFKDEKAKLQHESVKAHQRIRQLEAQVARLEASRGDVEADAPPPRVDVEVAAAAPTPVVAAPPPVAPLDFDAVAEDNKGESSRLFGAAVRAALAPPCSSATSRRRSC